MRMTSGNNLPKAEEVKIFSGEESREFWCAIHSLDALSTGEDIRNLLYLFGCKMQELETKIERLLHE